MKPFWVDDHLILARRVRIGRLEYIQGCLLNWPSIEQALLMAIELRVRDHGPGISGAASRRLFRSFSKSAHDAANSAPGVGLGLALSRRLARDMGARLRLDKTVTDGACFVLALPVSVASG